MLLRLPTITEWRKYETSTHVPAHGCSYASCLWLFLVKERPCACDAMALETTTS
jgi:hypothetical protein